MYRKMLVAIAMLVVANSVFSVPVGAAEKQPNILFIFADDQCFETIQAYGMEDIETPNLDRLCRSGLTFSHAYNMGSWSGAVCVASRTMLNTGRYIWSANKVYRSTEQERTAGRFWSEHMKKAGYKTYMTGKWHVRADATKAFDVTGHVRGGMPQQTDTGYNRPIDGQPDPWNPSDPKFGGFWKGGKHWSEVVGDDAVSFLNQSKKSTDPFFMYLAFNAPHDPRQSPQEYVDRYPLSRIKVPENFLTEYPYKDAIGCGKNLRDEKLAPFPRTHNSIKVNRQEYYAIITHMDVQIGRVLDHLDKTGQAENTYIFFTADHGLAVGRHGLLGKQNLYDHSVRVPFMVVGPNVPKNKRVDTPIYLQDVMPTTLELANVKKPAHVDFHSLLPLIKGEDVKSYDAIYGAYLSVQRSVKMDGFKLLMYPQAKVARLYNVADDPLEMKDLAGKAEYKDIQTKLFKRLLELQKELGDSVNLVEVFGEA
ncbi:MAG: arylsulfatase A-like enzyme [Pirellulaceae bacterium]|jgi:arylsulfatase A-like enzyme